MMKTTSLKLLAILIALAWTMPAVAEIYKWRDKDGSIRYTDTPPPAHAKRESIGGKPTPKSTGKAPLSPAASNASESNAAAPAGDAAKQKAPVKSPEDVANESADSAEAAAEKRRMNAEMEKKNKQEKEAQDKLRAENCKAARANMEAYKQGGRIYRTNEQGEREYLDDKSLQEGQTKAQDEINEYCN